MKKFLVALMLLSSIGFGNTWKDPIIGWTWSVVGIALPWTSALWSCPVGSTLPDQASLRYAMKRIQQSPLMEYFRQYQITHVWTSEEFDWQSAMAVHVEHGYSHNVWKEDLLGVVCVQK